MVKNTPASTGDARDVGLISGLGRSPGVGNGNPLQYSCLENPMDRGAWRATAHGVAKKSDTTEQLTLSLSTHYLRWGLQKRQKSLILKLHVMPSETKTAHGKVQELYRMNTELYRLCCYLVAKSTQLFSNNMDCGPPGSSVHGIPQARISEWVAIQWIILAQGSNPHLLPCRQILYY